MVAELVDYVVGVDTHRGEHTRALIEAATGTAMAQRTVPSNCRGYAQALRRDRGNEANRWHPGSRAEGAGRPAPSRSKTHQFAGRPGVFAGSGVPAGWMT
jgi:hypothetical protein